MVTLAAGKVWCMRPAVMAPRIAGAGWTALGLAKVLWSWTSGEWRVSPVAEAMVAPAMAISVVTGCVRCGLTTVRVRRLGSVGEMEAEPERPASVLTASSEPV